MKPQIGLRTHGGALALYGVLLVLPTLVLGFLQWHHIQTEAERELGEVPRDAEDAASRLRRALQEELDQLVTSETARPFEHYARYYSPDTPDGEFALLDSPLARSDSTSSRFRRVISSSGIVPPGRSTTGRARCGTPPGCSSFR